MLLLHRGLEQDEAVRGVLLVNADFILVADDLLVILVEVIPEKGELKIPLAGKGAVAFATIASPDTEQRDNVLAETGHRAGGRIAEPFRWRAKRFGLCRREGRDKTRQHC